MAEALALARPGITLTPVVVGQLHKSNKLSDYKGNLAGGLIENAHEFLTDGRVGLIWSETLTMLTEHMHMDVLAFKNFPMQAAGHMFKDRGRAIVLFWRSPYKRGRVQYVSAAKDVYGDS